MSKVIILGAGLAGLSTSYHIGHDKCVILEKNNKPYGHIQSDQIDGFTWDEGPHISFTKYDYVKEIFKKSVDGRYWDKEVQLANYYKGSWIPHPAQTNLYAVPEELREKCLEDFRKQREMNNAGQPENYMDWLTYAYGETFAKTFPAVYTRKYWTVTPDKMDTDWVGKRMYFPSVDDVEQGAIGPLPEQTHYFQKIRYPKTGGYESYGNIFEKGANIQFDTKITGIRFKDKTLTLSDGKTVEYEKLINTLPLDFLISVSDAPAEVKHAAEMLRCTSVLLVNVAAKHPTTKPDNLLYYIYDGDKYSTRINCTEMLSPENAPTDTSGIQVEVYFSKDRPLNMSVDDVAAKVVDELVEMGFVSSKKEVLYVNKKWIQWANVLFDLRRREAHEVILNWLEQHGLYRDEDDLHPTTDWDKKFKMNGKRSDADLWLSGRFGQWKYYWTDDCVLRGKYIAEKMSI
jgi:protoporphyrinogen oxidase